MYMCQTGLAEQKLFPNSNFIQTSFKKLTVTINGKKKQNSCFVKIWKLFGPFEEWRNFHKSLKLGIVLISCYLLTDLVHLFELIVS